MVCTKRMGEMFATVKFTPLLGCAPTVTTTLPVVAPAGTGAVMLVALHAVGVAVVPLNVTVLVVCVAPKFAPLIVTEVPTDPDIGLRLLIVGAELVLAARKATICMIQPPAGETGAVAL